MIQHFGEDAGIKTQTEAKNDWMFWLGKRTATLHSYFG